MRLSALGFAIAEVRGRAAVRCTELPREEMEANPAASGTDGVRERGGPSGAGGREQNREERPQCGTNGLPKHSYWLDLWLFLLFDLVLFIFVYLLP